MDIFSDKYRGYLAILNEELIPAMGCTEPITLAYAAAKCRDLLNEPVQSCVLKVSGPIIKNVKSVVVPHTGGQKGIKVAIAAGIIGGNANAVLEVLSTVNNGLPQDIQQYFENHDIIIKPADNDLPFYIDITEYGAGHNARVVLQDNHTNIILLERDGKTIWQKPKNDVKGGYQTDHSILNVAEILDFTNTVRMEDIKDLVARQISYNSAIAHEGLSGHWGAEIGRTLLEDYGDDLHIRARAAAAAGSDARMSGCELPVIIISGSGNQGITASLPVIEYARELGCNSEMLYRALVLSTLITVHQKTGIGPVSAFCGAVCAGVGAGCGIAYLQGADLATINHTIVNALAICSGMICDGAKPSCAAKISAAVDAGIMGYALYQNHQQFRKGEGIVKNDVEGTIHAVGEIAHEGMRETDKKILEIMLQE
jgi:L-cysteine desulfidase